MLRLFTLLLMAPLFLLSVPSFGKDDNERNSKNTLVRRTLQNGRLENRDRPENSTLVERIAQYNARNMLRGMLCAHVGNIVSKVENEVDRIKNEVARIETQLASMKRKSDKVQK